MNGPPPLGPGAPERPSAIAAFLTALVDRVVDQQDLMLLLELGSPKVRLPGAVPALPHPPDRAPGARSGRRPTPRFLADALLAPLNAHLISYQRDERGLTVEAIKAGVETLAHALTQHATRG